MQINKMFRRIGLILLCLHIGLLCAVAGQFARVVNVSTNLNIRESANAQSEIVGKIERDKSVEVLSNDNSGWTMIKYGSMTGYAKSTFLQPGCDKGQVPVTHRLSSSSDD